MRKQATRKQVVKRRNAPTRKASNSRTKKTHAKKTVVRKTNGRKKKTTRRRNSESTAAEIFESFHQKPSERTELLEVTEHYSESVAELGKLVSLEVHVGGERPVMLFENFGATKVCCTPDGGQLYFIGGKQDLDVSGLGLEDQMPKDHVYIGPCKVITYNTRKGFHNFESVNYFHHFGEDNGEMPVLNYDVLNKRIFLTGGTYQVRPEGIVN